MKVLSLFGWIEAGRVALDKLGIIPESYHSAEFDKYPASVAAHNYPDIVHIGSVTEVNGHDYEGIDLLIGWPPCQDLSIAGKRAGLEGSRSSLFWEYVRILNEAKPKYFLVENVASMPKEARQVMTEALFGIEPVLINSALVSAQNRKRLYWVGKRNEDGTYSKVDVPQPEDKGILLKHVLENIPLTDERWKPLDTKYVEAVSKRIAGWSERNDRLIAYQWDAKRSTAAEHVYCKENGKTDSCTVAHVPKTVIVANDKSFGVTAIYAWACPRDDFDKSNPTVIVSECIKLGAIGSDSQGNRIYSTDGKAATLGAATWGLAGKSGSLILNQEPYCPNPQIDGKQPSLADRIYHDEAKGTAVTTCFVTNVVRIPEATKLWYAELGDGECVDIAQPNSKTRRGRAMIDKANALTTSPQFITLKYQEPKYYWRKLTVRECARLQTFPDTFSFEAVSNSRAYKGIGNSWTVDVIAHIFSSMLEWNA